MASVAPAPPPPPRASNEIIPHSAGNNASGVVQTSTAPATAPAPPAANAIGVEFVQQYYAAHDTRLDQLHRFYAQDSELFVAGVGRFAGDPMKQNGDASSGSQSIAATGLREIDEALQKIAPQRAECIIQTVDALNSLNGAVVVAVTGTCMSKQSGSMNDGNDNLQNKKPKPFAQTFLLAPQRNGFYVKNDIVRFLDERGTGEHTAVPVSKPSSSVPKLPVRDSAPVGFKGIAGLESVINEKSAKKPVPVDAVALEELEAKQLMNVKSDLETANFDVETKSSVETPTDVPTVPGITPPEKKDDSPPAPFSYAAAAAKAKAQAEKTQVADSRGKQSGGNNSQTQKSVGSGATSRSIPPRVDSSPFTSVFVRNFPSEATVADLANAFSKYGKLNLSEKSDDNSGVTLRESKNQKSESRVEKHAFVEFAESVSAAKALAGETEVLGVVVGVEAKRERPPDRVEGDNGDGVAKKQSGDRRRRGENERGSRGGSGRRDSDRRRVLGDRSERVDRRRKESDNNGGFTEVGGRNGRERKS